MNKLHGRNWELLSGDVKERLADIPDASVQCVVTSPPFWGLRDYGMDGQVGLEDTPDAYVAVMVAIFRDVRRVLRDDGTLWLNLGDSYCASPKGSLAGQDKSGLTSTRTQEQSPVGVSKLRVFDKTSKQASNRSSDGVRRNRPFGDIKPKDLVGIPWMLAFALRSDGWYLRSDIIWSKPNPMPESVQDRPSKAHEYIFLLTKSQRYFYDAEAVKEEAVYGRRISESNGPMKGRNADSTSMWRNAGDRNTAVERGRHETGVHYELSGRNKRSVWTVPTQPYPEAHFATFPEEIPRLCILAGTSEKGCCPECGSSWKRIVEKDRIPTRPGTDSKINRASDDEDSPYNDHSGMVVGNRDPRRHTTETRTVGCEPGCECGTEKHFSGDWGECGAVEPNGVPYEPVPCAVLDPFAGSGTTLKVAVELGRKAIGIELNPEYAEMARARILNPKKHAANGQKTVKSAVSQLEMF